MPELTSSSTDTTVTHQQQSEGVDNIDELLTSAIEAMQAKINTIHETFDSDEDCQHAPGAMCPHGRCLMSGDSRGIETREIFHTSTPESAQN